MLNKYSNIPLYSQLKNLILNKIEKGEYTSGSKIPSEEELCDIYKISRPTVRQAIGDLTASGHLIKEKGKGTFVTESKSSVDIKKCSGFLDSILSGDTKTVRNIVSVEKVSSADHKVLREAFQLTDAHEYDFAKVQYITENNGASISKCTSYVPLILFPEIMEDVKQKKPSYDIMKGKYPFVASIAKMTMEIEFAGVADAEHLQIQSGYPLIKITSVLQAKTGQTVELTVASYRTDKCKLYFEEFK
jgi:DNA-binding GntR family transcriptional regulator